MRDPLVWLRGQGLRRTGFAHQDLIWSTLSELEACHMTFLGASQRITSLNVDVLQDFSESAPVPNSPRGAIITFCAFGSAWNL